MPNESNETEDIKLSDVVDIKILQEFQDAFALSTGMASIIVDNEGPITAPSNFTNFCIKYTRGSSEGYKRCNDCDIRGGKISAETGKPYVYYCHSGLMDFAAPIIVNGKQIGSVLGGQVLPESPDKDKFRATARALGIDEEKYLKALDEIKIVPKQQIEAAAQLLYVVANAISEIGYKSYKASKSTERINSMLQGMIDGVIAVNKDFVIEYCNPAICEMCGYSKSEIIGQKLGFLICNECQDNCCTPKLLISELVDPKSNISAYKKDGSEIPVEIKGSEISFDNEPLVLLLVRDITERKMAELEAIKNQNQIIKSKERETLLRKIIAKLSNSLDIEQTLSFISEEVAKLFNVQRAVIVEFSDPDDYATHQIRKEYKTRFDIKSLREIDKSNKAGAYWGGFLVKSPNSMIFDNMAESDTPEFFKEPYCEIGVKSALGAVIQKEQTKWGLVILFDYDTQRKWTEDDSTFLNTIADQIYISIHQAELYSKTKQQAEREKAILSNLPFIAWLKDEHSRLLSVNEPFAKNFGMKAEELLGKTDIDFMPQGVGQKYVNDDLKVVSSAQQMHFEEEIPSPDGGSRWYETFKTPVFNEEGQVIGTTGFARDITERKEIDRMKNEFISMISHELRTPLTSIRGALGLVSSNVLGVLPDKVSNLINIASNNTIRLVNLINDILDLEKIRAGKMDFTFEKHEIMSLIEETINFNVEYAKQYNIRYEIKERLDNAFVTVDKDKFIQVLTNLLSNAAKFSFENGVVDILVRRKKGLVSVSVVNKGAGIPEEAYSKIFESFSQVDSSDARKKGGTGLGLSISKSIVKRMNGNIGFTSKINEETTFYFEFPEDVKDEKSKSVLICEDNKTTAHCLKTMFETLGYKADTAFDAAEASILLSTKEYDLISLDLILPDKDGLILLKELRQHEKTKDLPVIIITASKLKPEIGENDKGVIAWLEKSFDMKDLEKTVNEVMLKVNKHKVEILHVENDKDILDIINISLEDIANVTKATTLTAAKELISSSSYDIIILDYVFPEGTSDKLIPSIKSGLNKNAKLIVFSAYEESQILSKYVDAIMLKTNVSNEKFKSCIEEFINNKNQSEQMEYTN